MTFETDGRTDGRTDTVDNQLLASQLRQQAAVLMRAADILSRAEGATEVAPSPRPARGRPRLSAKARRLRARLSGATGTSAVVLEAIRGGADTVAAIASAAKVKASTARTAILALEEAGRVRREGKSRRTRYRVVTSRRETGG